MAVAFDAGGTAQSVSPGTSVSIPITLGAGANRAVEVQFAGGTDTTGITATIGGETLSIITGTNGGATTGTVILGKSTSLTGAQTASVSWTTSQTAAANAISFTGANQNADAQQVFNGGANTASAAPVSLTITSTSGDLTTTIASAAVDPSPTNQTSRWVVAGFAAGDTGPGTGTTTHTWTNGLNMSGCNVVQAAAAAAVRHNRSLLGVGV